LSANPQFAVLNVFSILADGEKKLEVVGMLVSSDILQGYSIDMNYAIALRLGMGITH
jgi:hypothetical protein